MKFIKPQRLQPKYFNPLRKELEAIFYELVYKSIVTTIRAEIGHESNLNARVDALVEAIRIGKVQYTQNNTGDGVFTGKFNAKTSQQVRAIGGKLDKRQKHTMYIINQANVPPEIRAAGALAQDKAKRIHENITQALDNIQDGLDDKVELLDLTATENMVDSIDSDLRKSVADIEVAPIMPSLSDDAMINLSEDYNKNMRLYIKKWTEERIEKLRGEVETNAREGYRYDSLIEKIKEDYRVTQRKAEFLARQETALFMGTFRKERFGDIGVNHYKWSGRSKALTRADHWVLHGLIFAYDSPLFLIDAQDSTTTQGWIMDAYAQTYRSWEQHDHR